MSPALALWLEATFGVSTVPIRDLGLTPKRIQNGLEDRRVAIKAEASEKVNTEGMYPDS